MINSLPPEAREDVLQTLNKNYPWKVRFPVGKGSDTLGKQGGPTELTNGLRVNVAQGRPQDTGDYVLRQQDDLPAVANCFGVTPTILEMFNPGISRGNFRAGTSVRIPLSGDDLLELERNTFDR